MTQSRIEPLSREVRGRWKHLFASNGLTFKPDGSITRLRGKVELGWDTLSGGERTWARIITHLIVMGTTTSLPFAWFDEPLEHLDPQLRHAVAATLATATLGGSPQQLLVTTYEHGIAQQLADDTDGAGIITIRESGAELDPTPSSSPSRDGNHLRPTIEDTVARLEAQRRARKQLNGRLKSWISLTFDLKISVIPFPSCRVALNGKRFRPCDFTALQVHLLSRLESGWLPRDVASTVSPNSLNDRICLVRFAPTKLPRVYQASVRRSGHITSVLWLYSSIRLLA